MRYDASRITYVQSATKRVPSGAMTRAAAGGPPGPRPAVAVTMHEFAPPARSALVLPTDRRWQELS